MDSVAIVYFSATGHTHLMAEAIAAGVHRCGDTRVDLLRIEGTQIQAGRWFDEGFIERLQTAKALIFRFAHLYGHRRRPVQSLCRLQQ
jgi:NAD(P)H dehydrogenase (quinone)